jgi:hypothetical protein
MREQETGGGRSDSPSDTVRQFRQKSDSPTFRHFRHFRHFRQCPTLHTALHCQKRSDMVRHGPTLVRHWSDSPTFRHSDICPTLSDILPTLSDSSDISDSQGSGSGGGSTQVIVTCRAIARTAGARRGARARECAWERARAHGRMECERSARRRRGARASCALPWQCLQSEQ